MKLVTKKGKFELKFLSRQKKSLRTDYFEKDDIEIVVECNYGSNKMFIDGSNDYPFYLFEFLEGIFKLILEKMYLNPKWKSISGFPNRNHFLTCYSPTNNLMTLFVILKFSSSNIYLLDINYNSLSNFDINSYLKFKSNLENMGKIENVDNNISQLKINLVDFWCEILTFSKIVLESTLKEDLNDLVRKRTLEFIGKHNKCCTQLKLANIRINLEDIK